MNNHPSNSNFFHSINPKFLFFILLVILMVCYIIGAIQSIYLFDSSIIYNYGYLISIGFTPFKDFTTPLLPGLGLIQNFAYKIFGVNYMSGVYTAMVIVVIEYIILGLLLTKISNNKNKSILFSFLITLSGIPIIGNLYYNHLLISLSVIFFLLKYYCIKKDKNNFINSILSFSIVFFIISVKIHWGLCLLFIQLILDLIFFNANYFKLIKLYLIGFFSGLIILMSIFFLSNNADISSFLLNVKGISVLSNINRLGLLKFFNIPIDIFSIIEITPFTIFLLIILVPFVSGYKKNNFKISPEFIIPTLIVFYCFIIVLNSADTFSLFFPLQITIIILATFSLRERASNLLFSNFLRGLLVLHLLFIIPYVINGNRKRYNEAVGTFGDISLNLLSKFKSKGELNSVQAKSYFKNIYLSAEQINSFNFIDSAISGNQSKTVFFGPELELLNVVYKIKPIKGFPLWIHPGLTVTENKYKEIALKLELAKPDLIFISKKRYQYLPFFDEFIIKNNYTLIQNSKSDIFVSCYQLQK